jgi:hypothetical protein
MEAKKPLAIIHKIGKEKCQFSKKLSEGVTVTFRNGTVKRAHLSWAAMRKLLEFTEEDADVKPEAVGGEAKPKPVDGVQAAKQRSD